MATGPEVLLMLTLVMSQHVPDKNYQIPGLTVDECFDQAKDYIKQGLTKRDIETGGIARVAACLSKQKAEDGDI